MKKQKNIFSFLLVIFLFLFLAIFFSRQSLAWIAAPYFDLNINIETDGSDDTFSFKLITYISGGGGEMQDATFSVSTASSSAQYLHNAEIEDNTQVILKLVENPKWKLEQWDCTSDNLEITFISEEPGTIIMSGLAYSAVLCKINFKENRINPVIIIPGILSSYLNRNDDDKTELWPNLKKILLSLGRDKFLDELALNQIGQINFSNPLALPTDIIRSLGGKDFFAGLISELEGVGYIENENLFVFPYDWRLDIRSSVDDLPSEILVTLKEKIDDVITKTRNSKVDIIAHSMGGLLTKQYIFEYGSEEKIEKFIDIGTPHLGAPNAFKTLFAGDNLGIKFGFLGLNTLEIKRIIRNMPSAYQLLPSENYLKEDLPDYRYFVYDMVDYDGDGVRGRLNLEQSYDFLKNTGANDVLLDITTHVHDDLDGQIFDSEKIKTYNLVGCGTPTVGKIFITGKDRKGPIVDLAYISGDGTVPERSARSFNADVEYQFSGQIHAQMSSHTKVREVVANILLGKDSDIVDDANCEIADSNLYSIRGPVKIDVPEDEVYPLYDEIYDNTFYVTPASDDEPIKISASSTGKFSAKVKKMRGGRVVSTSNFNNIKIQSATSTFNISKDTENNFVIITDEVDDVHDTISADSNYNGDSLDDLIPPETTLEIFSGATSSKIVFIPDSLNSIVYFATSSTSTDTPSFLTGTSTVIVSPGIVYVYYYSIDPAGNVEEEKFEEVFVDYKAPPEADDNTPEMPITIVENVKRKSGGGGDADRGQDRENPNGNVVTAEVRQLSGAELTEDVGGAIAAVTEVNSESNEVLEVLNQGKVVKSDSPYVNTLENVATDQMVAAAAAAVEYPGAILHNTFWWLFFVLLLLILSFAVEQNFRRK